MSKLWIDTKIVYEPGKLLAYAYNRAMQTTSAEWVLFLDQDLFMCNPHWYEMCLSAIDQVGGKTGWITCVTNRIGGNHQRIVPPVDTDHIPDHIAFARALYYRHGHTIERIPGALSGFFILTNKTAWRI